MVISQEICLASMQERDAPKEWKMKVMQKLTVQEWSRDSQKQVTKGGYGCLEVKKIEPHVLHEQKPMEGLNDGVKQLGERRDSVVFSFRNKS